MIQKLPNRPEYSERAFRKYEPTIISIVKNLPNITVIDPHPLSVETFSHRLRNAVKAYGYSNWESPISREALYTTFRLFRNGGQFVINIDGEKITVGPQKSSQTHNPGVKKIDISGLYETDVLNGSNINVVTALLTLLNEDLIRGPIKLNDDSVVNTEIQNFPNVEFIVKDGLTILI